MDSTLVISNFFLCFIRWMGLTMFMPLLSSPHFPAKMKALMAYFIAFIVFLNLPVNSFVEMQTDVDLLLVVFKEFVVGVVIGLNVALVMEMLNFAGSIVSTPMGLSIATAIDPASGQQSTTVGQFNMTLGTLLFLIINGHHYAMEAFLHSYEIIPFGMAVFEQSSIPHFVEMYYKIFVISLQMSMPLLVPLILIHYSLGVVVRTLPRLNIFMIGIPLQICLGMITYVITLPYLVKLVKVLFSQSFEAAKLSLKVFLP